MEQIFVLIVRQKKFKEDKNNAEFSTLQEKTKCVFKFSTNSDNPTRNT